MSNDDDIDALLDDALDDFDTQQKAAEEKAHKLASDRAISAKVLEDALQYSSGDRISKESDHNVDAVGDEQDLPQLMLLLHQLAVVEQKMSQTSSDPSAPENTAREDKLFEGEDSRRRYP